MEITERLSSLKSYISFLAYSYSKDHSFRDDLAQEAMVAVWKELLKAQESGRAVNDSFLLQKARWVMLNALKAHGRDRHAPVEDELLEDLVPPSYQDSGMAMHTSEIRQAIAGLTPKQQEYVYLRFWRGWSAKSDLPKAGYSNTLWYHPSSGARRKLADKLGRLAELV